jgi:hypothetical protein
MIVTTSRRRDVLKRHFRFRDARTGEYVSRAFALLWPQYTVKERVW